MNFTDATLVRLADPSTRAAVFDDVALEQLLSAAYDSAALSVGAPFTPIFDEVQLGVGASTIGRVEGAWSISGAPVRTDARFDFTGFGMFPTARVDVLWRGAIAARTILETSPVTEVGVEWVAPSNGDTHTARTRVTFAAPSDVSSPRRLPMSVGLLVRDAGFSVSELVWESRLVRDRLEPAGVERARNGGPKPHHSIVIGWVVPAAVFNDADWPGATAGIRRATAGQWLAREGIGLVVV